MILICDHKLLIFNLLLIMSVWACEMKEILNFTAYEGGKAEIRCPYESGYETKNKYLCRGECQILYKDILVESGSAAKDRRFSLTDDTTTHIFTVTITDLRTDDEGQYWCAVRTGFGSKDLYTEIHLEIKPVSVVSAVAGDHLNITCYYENDLKNDVKFLCKGSDLSLCETSAIKVSSERKSNGRFSLRDYESARVFTVNITDLTQEDSGIYWFGAVERGKNKWISAIDLNISGVPSESPKPATTAPDHTSKPATTAPNHTSKPATADPATNRPVTSVVPLSGATKSSAVLLNSSSSNNASKQESGFTVIIMLMVVGILTGFGFSLFMYFRCRQKDKGNQPSDVVQGPSEHLPNGNSEPNREATHTVSDYEDVINMFDDPVYSSVLPVFDGRDVPVYALAQLPSGPSDDLNYSTIKFSATHHSDRASDGEETCDYTTVRP